MLGGHREAGADPQEERLIIVTGGAGFIGSCVVAGLNRRGQSDILIVDDLGRSDKWKNLRNLAFEDYLDKSQLFAVLERGPAIEAIVHMGACSRTTESDAHYLMENNYHYSLNLARYAVERGIRFIYASSAATYGNGTAGQADNTGGYDDDEASLQRLQPLNMYGYSKQIFDLKVRREGWLRQIAGLKFFNVYGPNEYHKQGMTSVVFQAFPQIQTQGRVRLFKSHRPDVDHGEQQRDFIYIRDVVEIILFLLDNPHVTGLFNVGTGKARSFKDLALATFAALEREPVIDYFDMPKEIRDRYQYFTRAEMSKLVAAGYTKPMTSLEDGVADYVRNYLAPGYRHF